MKQTLQTLQSLVLIAAITFQETIRTKAFVVFERMSRSLIKINHIMFSFIVDRLSFLSETNVYTTFFAFSFSVSWKILKTVYCNIDICQYCLKNI